jgi:hypothetical protein
LFSFFVLACLAAAPTARANDTSAFVASEDESKIVFIQNQNHDRKMSFLVFGPDKRCVAEVQGREAQVLPTPPGAYIFYVVGYEQTVRIELYVEAGRTYFIRLHTVDKSIGAAARVTLVRRASDEHKLLGYHLEGAHITHTKDDKSCYGKPLRERNRRTVRRINEANAEWRSGDDIDRDENTLIEKDGLTPEDISRL